MNKISINSIRESPLEKTIEAGQLYKMRDSGNSTRIFMVCSLANDTYSLIELNDGVAWDGTGMNINSIADFDDFTLLENVEIKIVV